MRDSFCGWSASDPHASQPQESETCSAQWSQNCRKGCPRNLGSARRFPLRARGAGGGTESMQQVARTWCTNRRAKSTRRTHAPGGKSQRFQRYRNSKRPQYSCCRNRNTKVARRSFRVRCPSHDGPWKVSKRSQSHDSSRARTRLLHFPLRQEGGQILAPARQVLPSSRRRLHFRG